MDFETIEQEFRDQADEYRSRHLSVKLSLYAGFFAFEGLALAAAALISSRAALNATLVMGITLISTLILFLQHRWLLHMFAVLGYTKISIKSQRDLEEHHALTEDALRVFKHLGPWRKNLDRALFVLACVQVVLLGFAAWRTI